MSRNQNSRALPSGCSGGEPCILRTMSPENRKPKPGDSVILTEVPPGMLDDLPIEDQQAISEVVGKPILLNEFDDAGRAELEFKDRNGEIHFIYVSPEFIRKAQ
jgi:hypothetical protein